jgi:nitrate reductase molybdenum cofactor assembly chaperone
MDIIRMEKPERAMYYRLISELLLYPEERNDAFVSQALKALDAASADILSPIVEFLADPKSQSPDEYLDTIEISAKCPLYLGTYLFDEPTSCREMGMSGRNSYMLELVNAYAHFGLELNGRELADFLPVLLEFLAMSLERSGQDQIGLRRRIVEVHIFPGLNPILTRFQENESCYALLIQALTSAVQDDIQSMAGDPRWMPPPGPKPQIIDRRTMTKPEELGL